MGQVRSDQNKTKPGVELIKAEQNEKVKDQKKPPTHQHSHLSKGRTRAGEKQQTEEAATKSWWAIAADND